MARARNLAALVVLLAACAHHQGRVEQVRSTPSTTVAHQTPPAALYAPPTTTATTVAPTTTSAPPRAPQTVKVASVGEPVIADTSTPPPEGEPPDSDFDRLQGCECPPGWHCNTGNGYYGGLQFSKSTWNAYAAPGRPDGSPYPPRADLASREDQIEVARRVWRARGWQPWPACSRKLGLR